jgi:glutathione-regulated potassium-efflux system ancillary protein KefG
MDEARYRVLILLAHPSLYRSRINVVMRNAVKGIPGVTLHELYDAYPDFFINVQYEKALLLEHQLLVFQHPLYWYSVPPILKLWQDVVFERGFAYGEGGGVLQGKELMQAISTGGKAESFSREGNNYFTMDELLFPMQATARRCGMIYRPPLVIHDGYEQTDAAIKQHAQCYRDLLVAYTREGSHLFEPTAEKN